MTLFKIVFALGLAIQVTLAAEQDVDSVAANKQRDGKLFSLFSVVTFKNQGCATNQGTVTSGAARNGTCYTSSECTTKGGISAGNCAAGFGVCCFFAYTATATISENCTYIRNPGFPTASTGSTTATFTVSKCSSDVCVLRLDFETFSTSGPLGTTETVTTNAPCTDSFVVTTTSGYTSPTLCGLGTGEHMYADMGPDSTDTASLTFTFATATGNSRTYEIKVTQVECSNAGRPPMGCYQYHTTLAGRLTTFNFYQTTSTNQVHLMSLSDNICIRQAQGYCCVQYTECSATNSFSIDGYSVIADVGDIGTNCSDDWIEIPGGAATCQQSGYFNTNSRYCGRFLSAVQSSTLASPVCDCTAPFNVFVKTNTGLDDTTGIIAGTVNNRGVCLDYKQIPCA